MLLHALRRALEATPTTTLLLRPAATSLLSQGAASPLSPPPISNPRGWLQDLAALQHLQPHQQGFTTSVSARAADAALEAKAQPLPTATTAALASSSQQPPSSPGFTPASSAGRHGGTGSSATQSASTAGAASAPASASTSAPAQMQDRFASGARKVTRFGRRDAATGLHGIVHVYDAASNIILTFTDAAGRVLTWTSAGSVGFKNARKALPVAAEKAAEELARRALKLGYSTVTVKMKGIGHNKQYAVQSLAASGLTLTQLMDVTAIPYNGCRRPKKRRI